MIRIKAKSQSGSVHIVVGKITGGIPNKKPGVSTPFKNLEDAIEHLERNGWEILEILK